MTPLLAYLIGFSAIQLFIALLALLAMKCSELVRSYWEHQILSLMRFLALAISAIGIVFFTRAILS